MLSAGLYFHKHFAHNRTMKGLLSDRYACSRGRVLPKCWPSAAAAGMTRNSTSVKRPHLTPPRRQRQVTR